MELIISVSASGVTEAEPEAEPEAERIPEAEMYMRGGDVWVEMQRVGAIFDKIYQCNYVNITICWRVFYLRVNI